MRFLDPNILIIVQLKIAICLRKTANQNTKELRFKFKIKTLGKFLVFQTYLGDMIKVYVLFVRMESKS